MSAGHGHKRPNLYHHEDLNDLLLGGGAPELMQRWQRVDTDHDIPDLAGYNVDGTVRYLDRDVYHALRDPNYASHLIGAPIDTGLSVDATIQCLMEHEAEEKVVLDADNPVDTYLPAHEIATAAEHQKVRRLGGKPVAYERALAAAIKFCEHKVVHKPPADLACAPYLDESDADDKRTIEQFKRLGVLDASKIGKAAVKYTKSAGADQCQGCASWQDDPQQTQYGLGRCALVSGLVRVDRWCERFNERETTG